MSETQPSLNSSKSPEQWFDELEVGPSQKPQKKSWKVVVIIAAAMLLIGGGITLLAILNRGVPCLGTSDYRDLTGIEYTDDTLNPKESFYAFTIDFQTDSASYDSTVTPSAKQIIEQLANFYKERSNKSMLFTIDSDYFTSDQANLASQRIATVKNDLSAAGVPESLIITSTPSQIQAEPETEAPSIATISITSSDVCK